MPSRISFWKVWCDKISVYCTLIDANTCTFVKVKYKARYEDVITFVVRVNPEIRLQRQLTPDIVITENMAMTMPRQLVYQPKVQEIVLHFKREFANGLLEHLCMHVRDEGAF